jgi:hypothetical protein
VGCKKRGGACDDELQGKAQQKRYCVYLLAEIVVETPAPEESLIILFVGLLVD